MAWTNEQLQALEEAIAQGALTIEFNGKRITYRSLDEMMRLRDQMKKSLGNTQPGATTVYTKFSKGL